MKLQIKDFCTIKTGYSFRGQVAADENGTFYLLQAKDINAFGEINYHQCIKISTDNIKRITPLSQGEIVLTARGTFKAAVFDFHANHAGKLPGFPKTPRDAVGERQ